jgi:hypothetical protein
VLTQGLPGPAAAAAAAAEQVAEQVYHQRPRTAQHAASASCATAAAAAAPQGPLLLRQLQHLLLLVLLLLEPPPQLPLTPPAEMRSHPLAGCYLTQCKCALQHAAAYLQTLDLAAAALQTRFRCVSHALALLVSERIQFVTLPEGEASCAAFLRPRCRCRLHYLYQQH